MAHASNNHTVLPKLGQLPRISRQKTSGDISPRYPETPKISLKMGRAYSSNTSEHWVFLKMNQLSKNFYSKKKNALYNIAYISGHFYIIENKSASDA